MPTLSHILTEILPLHFFLALTLDILNTVNFEPESKDEEMQSGVLQLPEHSLIIMSENTISEGKLEEKGNVHLLTVDLHMSESSLYTQRCSEYPGTTESNSITAPLLQFSIQSVHVTDGHPCRCSRAGKEKFTFRG